MLLKCPEHGYTLQAQCPTCGQPTVRPGPAKYSPEDRYGAYRRRLKRLHAQTGGDAAETTTNQGVKP